MSENPTSTRTLRVLSVAVAVFASVTGWILIEEVIGLDLRSPTLASGDRFNIGLLEVVVVSLTASLAAWGVLLPVERWTKNPRQLWTTMAGIGLLASMIPLVVSSGIEWQERVALGFLHGLVAASLIVGFRPTIRA